MSYDNDPWADLRYTFQETERFLNVCGNFPTTEQKDALRKNLHSMYEIERILRNARTISADELAEQCSTLLSKMRSLL